jgi:phage gp46-like protein
MDIKLNQNSFYDFDISILNTGDFETDDGLETAIIISGFTDAKVTQTEYPSESQRGWWADEFVNDGLGSKLWLCDRSKISNELFSNLKKYWMDCLQWMVDSSSVKTIDVEVVQSEKYTVNINIEITKNDNSVFEYSVPWFVQIGK